MNYPIEWHLERFRHAKDRRDMIEIISDLEECTLSDVVDMLENNGIHVIDEWRYPRTPGCSTELALKIVHDREKEMSFEEIATKYGISEQIVSSVITSFVTRGGFTHLKMRCSSKKAKRKITAETISEEQRAMIREYMNGSTMCFDVRSLSKACKMSSNTMYGILREMYGEEYVEIRRAKLKENIYKSYGV